MGRPEATKAEVEGVAPPAYAEDHTEPPAYQSAVAGPSTAAAPSPYQRLPLAFNVYYGKSWSTELYRLGEHEDQPRIAFTLHSGFSGKPRIALHDGIDAKDPILASANSKGLSHKRATITVPGRQGSSLGSISEEMHTDSSFIKATYNFSFNVGRGKDVRREQFQWRTTRGNEVKNLDKHGWGRKLVRLGGDMPPGVGGSRDTRDLGEASDGSEIVAVWTDHVALNLKKVAKFQFLGAGATGEFGEEWSLMALLSALRIWDYMTQPEASYGGVAAGGD